LEYQKLNRIVWTHILQLDKDESHIYILLTTRSFPTGNRLGEI